MSDTLVARRYARALRDAAVDGGVAESVDRDFQAVSESLDGSLELRQLFRSPIVSREKKSAIVDKLFGARLHATTLDFLRMMIAKRREGVFGEVARAYRQMRDEDAGIVRAHARSAVALSPESEAGLRRSLEARTGKKVHLDVELDPSLIGGVVVRVGDEVFDGSVANRLARLREQFTDQPIKGSRKDVNGNSTR